MNNIPKLNRLEEDSDGVCSLKTSILSSDLGVSRYLRFENIETKERPIILEIDLATGDCIIARKTNEHKKDNINCCSLIFEKTVLDLSKYHIVFK